MATKTVGAPSEPPAHMVKTRREDRDVSPPPERVPGPGEAAPSPAERKKAERLLEKARAEPPAEVFKPPVGAEVVEKTAQGEPAVYQKNGERYYAPGSTMYKQGWRTESDYIAAQKGIRTVLPSGKVTWRYGPDRAAVETGAGNIVHITPKQADNLAGLRGNAQFQQSVNLGLIERGAVYVPETGNYIPASEIQRISRLTTAELKRVQDLSDVEAIGQAKLAQSLKLIEPYKTNGEQYDLYGLIKYGQVFEPELGEDPPVKIDIPLLHSLFGKETITKAQQQIKRIEDPFPGEVPPMWAAFDPITPGTVPYRASNYELGRQIAQLPESLQYWLIAVSGARGKVRVADFMTDRRVRVIPPFNELPQEQQKRVIDEYRRHLKTYKEFGLASLVGGIRGMFEEFIQGNVTAGLMALSNNMSEFTESAAAVIEKGFEANVARIEEKPLWGGYTDKELIPQWAAGAWKFGTLPLSVIPLLMTIVSMPIGAKDIKVGVTQAKKIGKQFVEFATVGAPSLWGTRPGEAIGLIGPMLLSPAGLIHGLGKKIYVYVHPRGMPMELIGTEFSTGRIPVGGLPTGDLGAAVGQSLVAATKKGALPYGEVTVGGITVSYLRPAVQRVYGDVLWHGTGDIGFLREARGIVGKDGLYLNPYAAQAYITSGKNPGFVMMIVDPAKLKSVPVPALKGITSSEWYIRQAPEGLYRPSKVWRGDFETEIVAAPGTPLVLGKRPNLLTRILSGNPEDFFTVYTGPSIKGVVTGKILPITIATQKGVLKSLPTRAELYAMKLLLMEQTLRDMSEMAMHPRRTITDILKRRLGPKGLREMEVSAVDLSMMRGMEILKGTLHVEAIRKAGKRAKAGTPAFEKIYNEYLQKSYEKAAKQIKKKFGREVDRMYERNRGDFETLYRHNLEYMWRNYTRWSRGLKMDQRNIDRLVKETRRRTPSIKELRRRPGYVRERLIRAIPYRVSRRDIRERARERPMPRLRGVREPVERPLDPREIGRRKKRPSELLRERVPERERPRERRPRETREERERRERREGREERERRERRDIKTLKERKIIRVSDKDGKERAISLKTAVGWMQGQLKFGDKLKELWYVGVPPFKSSSDFVRMFNRPTGATIVGDAKTAYKTIQSWGYAPSRGFFMDMGIMDIGIKPPKKIGEPGAMKFKRDVKGRTKHKIRARDIPTVKVLQGVRR